MAGRLFWEDVDVGAELAGLPKIATTQMLVRYAGTSGDFNPLHYEDTFAKTSGVDRSVVHGQLKKAWLVQLVVDWLGGDPASLKKFSCRFRGVDLPRLMKTMTEPQDGETWICKGKVTKKDVVNGQHLVHCDVWVENGKGEKTTTGSAVGILPSRGQQPV
jgi:hypothetical protein